jgi:hypothetical protein
MSSQSYKSSDSVFGGSIGRSASPFNDMAQSYLPKSQIELFQWCQYYLDNSPIIQQAVRRMSAYPITDIVPVADKDVEKERALGIISLMDFRGMAEQVALQYHAFGNAFATIIPPFNRVYRCVSCKKESTLTTLEEAHIKKKTRGSLFRIKRVKNTRSLSVSECPACKQENPIIIVIDKPRKAIDETKISLLNPINIRIHKNPVSGSCEYRYVMPAEMRKAILLGDKFFISTTPKIFIDAAIGNKDIILNDKSVYHLAKTTANTSKGWGHSIIQGVFRELFHSQVIKKAAEALAQQHINPLLMIYPSDSGQSNIYQHLDLSHWKTTVEQQLAKWRRDPNHIPIMPVPTGVDYIGGQHKSLDPTASMKHINEEITMGIGVPTEFLIGGTSFSGSSISLRMLENDFINLRTKLMEMFNSFVIPALTKVADVENFEVKFTNLRTADDVQQKDLIMRLGGEGKLSTETVLTELGFDFKKERDRLVEEQKIGLSNQREVETDSEGGANAYNLEMPMNGSGELRSDALVSFMAEMMNNSPDDAKQYYSEMMSSQSPAIFNAVSSKMKGGSPSQDNRPAPQQKPPRRTNTSV